MFISENLQLNDLWSQREEVLGFCWPLASNGKSWDFNTNLTCKTLAEDAPYIDSIKGFPKGVHYNLNHAPKKINECAKEIDGNRAWLTARPSSSHPDSILVGMVDGSVHVVNENVEKLIYISGMCPCDKKSKCKDLRQVMFQLGELID